MKMERQKFIIDRSKWRSGGTGRNAVGEGGTRLLNEQGFMCCLGQVCLQLGIDESIVKHRHTPEDILKLSTDEKNKLKELSLLKTTEKMTNSEFCYNLMNANDIANLTTANRELQLIHLFNQIDVDIEFKGEVVRLLI
jgi:hypothetical protein